MSHVEVTGTILQPSEWDVRKLRNKLRTAEDARLMAEGQVALLTKEVEELQLELRLAKRGSRGKD